MEVAAPGTHSRVDEVCHFPGGAMAVSRRGNGLVFVIDGSRTPFLGADPFDESSVASALSPVDLAVAAGRPLLLRQPFAAEDLDEVLLGCVAPIRGEANPGQAAAARLGAPQVPGWTVQEHAASGLRAVANGCRAVLAGGADLVLAGGAGGRGPEPLGLSAEAAAWLGDWRRASVTERARLLAGLRPHLFTLDDGPTAEAEDELTGQGWTRAADALGYRFGIRRADADGFALESHRRLAQAADAGHLVEIEPLFGPAGVVYQNDDGVRADLTLEDLAASPPLRRYGEVTALNRCGTSHGAAWVLLASEAACSAWALAPRARVVDCQWARTDGALAGLAPVIAATALLKRHRLTLHDVAAWELEESSAAQVLAWLAAWRDAEFCVRHLGLDAPMRLDHRRLNVDGGAIALGCPLGASGARLVLHLVEVLRRRGERWGMAALAGTGGQGGAVLVEAL